MDILSQLIGQVKELAENKDHPVDADTPLPEILDSARVLALWDYVDKNFIEGVNLYRDHKLKTLREIAENIHEALSAKK